MLITHNVHSAYYRDMQIRNQGYYAQWALCIIPPWVGRRFALVAAMYAVTCGFPAWSTQNCAPARSAVLRFGTKGVSMDGRGRRGIKGCAANELQSRKRGDSSPIRKADADLFRALLSNSCNYLQGSLGYRNTPNTRKASESRVENAGGETRLSHHPLELETSNGFGSMSALPC
jgi:hypothetical protein